MEMGALYVSIGTVIKKTARSMCLEPFCVPPTGPYWHPTDALYQMHFVSSMPNRAERLCPAP